MNYTICITGGPMSQAPATALNFAISLIKKKYKISKVFFYADGVYNCSKLIAGSQYQQIISRQWQDLIAKYQLNAVVCVSAALKRGIIDREESELNDLDCHNIADCYQVSGITDWLTGIVESDRQIIFG